MSLSHISKRYGDHLVIDDVTLQVDRGEVLAIIGPSGAGKSTLLRCINLLEFFDIGSLSVAGLTITDPKSLGQDKLMQLRRRAGMVFQNFNLFPHLSVLRNVSLPQERVLGRSRKEADERSMELLAKVHLAERAGYYPSRCSGGQQQRVAIARALAIDPQVMLFDEPTSALDPELGVEVLNTMKELADEGMTMIVVTHEMQFARDIADEVVVMADGRVLERGAPEQVFQKPTHHRTEQFLRAVLDR